MMGGRCCSRGRGGSSPLLAVGCELLGPDRCRSKHSASKAITCCFDLYLSTACSSQAPTLTSFCSHNESEGKRLEGSFSHFMDVDSKKQEGLRT